MYVHMHVRVFALSHSAPVEVREQLSEPVLPLHHVGSGNQNSGGRQVPFLVSHLSGLLEVGILPAPKMNKQNI